MIEFDSRDKKKKDRREIPCFINKDRRENKDRRGKAQKDIDKKNRKDFEKHLKAQR